MLNDPLLTISAAQIMLGRYTSAQSNLDRVLSLLAGASIPDAPEAAAAYSNLGLLHFRQGRYFEAEQSYRRAAGLRGSGPDLARNLASLARVYATTGRYDKAEATCAKALDLLSRLLGPDHPEVAAALQVLAQVR